MTQCMQVKDLNQKIIYLGSINMKTDEDIEKIEQQWKELFDAAVDMLDGTLIYIAHIRRYYPKVHNKTVVSKKYLKHEESINE